MRSHLSWLGFLSLLVLITGCTRSQVGPNGQANLRPPGEKVNVEKRAEGPKRPPQPMTCVKMAQFFEQIAEGPKVSEPGRRRGYEQARIMYQQALHLDPNCQPAIVGLARLYDKEANYAQALTGYQEAIKHAPSDATLWFQLGMCWGRQKQWESGVECLQKAVSLDSKNETYSNCLGWMMARAGRYGESMDHFRRTLGDARAHYNMALMLQHLGEKEGCRQYLESALRLDPKLAEARDFLAQLDAEKRPAPATAPIQQIQPAVHEVPIHESRQVEPPTAPAPIVSIKVVESAEKPADATEPAPCKDADMTPWKTAGDKSSGETEAPAVEEPHAAPSENAKDARSEETKDAPSAPAETPATEPKAKRLPIIIQ